MSDELRAMWEDIRRLHGDNTGSAMPDYNELMALHLQDNPPRGGGGGSGGGGNNGNSRGLTATPKDEIWKAATRCFKNVRPPKATAGSGHEPPTCSICLEPLAEHTDAKTRLSSSQRKAVCSLPCKHLFHTPCITEAVKRGQGKPCCPLCRFDLLTCKPAAAAN